MPCICRNKEHIAAPSDMSFIGLVEAKIQSCEMFSGLGKGIGEVIVTDKFHIAIIFNIIKPFVFGFIISAVCIFQRFSADSVFFEGKRAVFFNIKRSAIPTFCEFPMVEKVFTSLLESAVSK